MVGMEIFAEYVTFWILHHLKVWKNESFNYPERAIKQCQNK